jgi:transcriptional regulator with XRE-family HTH domain
MPSGRRPNLERRRRMADLRAEGMSYAQIGIRLGVTRKSVERMLNRKPLPRYVRVRCRECAKVLNPAGAVPRDDRTVLCLSCLSTRPNLEFGEHLKAFRLAAGLKIVDLARKAGLPSTVISSYEHGRIGAPTWQKVACLFQALGVQFFMNQGDATGAFAPIDNPLQDGALVRQEIRLLNAV